MNNNPAVKTFLSATIVLFVLLLATGALTYLIPAGEYDPATGVYTQLDQEGLSPLVWLSAPITVLFSDSGPLVIAIIIFLLIIGGSIHVLKEIGIIRDIIVAIVNRYGNREGLLMAIIIFLFMAIGAFIGVFEEIVPLVPMIILLSRAMGWDELTGLGMSVLASGLGFAAAVTNPFTIGVAQQLADIPLFSGALLRVFVFISVYITLFLFLYKRSKKLAGEKIAPNLDLEKKLPQKIFTYFISVMVIMFMVIGLSPFLKIISDISLPLIGLFFLIAALGSGFMSDNKTAWVFRQFWIGIRDMLPAIILVLLATGIKQIMIEGQILGTVLFKTSTILSTMSPSVAVILIFGLVMLMNFFIGSGSAKAFILMPLIIPISDMLGIGRQLGILAFQFGDGFSNVLYPTNAVLLIALSLSQVSYSKWFRFVLPLQIFLIILSIIWIYIAYMIGYGL